DDLFAILDDRRHGQHKLAADPSTNELCADLDLGRRAAASGQIPEEDAISFLPKLWRYSVLRHSLSSLSDVYSDNGYLALTLTGRAGQAGALAELVGSPIRRVSVLGRLATALADAGNVQDAQNLGTRALAEAATIDATSPDEYGTALTTLLHTCLELATIRVPMPADSLAQLESLVSHARQALLPSLLADMTRLYLTVGDSEAGERLLSGLEAMIEDRAEQPELDRLLSVLTALYV